MGRQIVKTNVFQNAFCTVKNVKKTLVRRSTVLTSLELKSHH